ncbi:MAG: hypothetical protein AAGK14_07100 [Verrucomicrobiota bacterium]
MSWRDKLWYVVRRWWKLAGAMFLLFSPVLYLLSAGPLFLLVRWPVETGHYELSAKRQGYYEIYITPIENALRSDYLPHPGFIVYYNQYLDWWKLPYLDSRVDYPDDQVTVEASYWNQSAWSSAANKKTKDVAVQDLTEEMRMRFGGASGLHEAIYIKDRNQIYIRGTADVVKLVPILVLGEERCWLSTGLRARR